MQVFVEFCRQYLLQQSSMPKCVFCRLCDKDYEFFLFYSGVMVAYLFFKNLTKVVNTAEDGIGVIMKVSAIRFIGVFSYRYLRSDYIYTHAHIIQTFVSHIQSLYSIITPFEFHLPLGSYIVWFQSIKSDGFIKLHFQCNLPLMTFMIQKNSFAKTSSL